MDVVRDRVSQQPTTACKVLSAASVNTCHDMPHTKQTYTVFLVRRAVALGPRDGAAAVGGAGCQWPQGPPSHCAFRFPRPDVWDDVTEAIAKVCVAACSSCCCC